jgi:hypothetical protein
MCEKPSDVHARFCVRDNLGQVLQHRIRAYGKDAGRQSFLRIALDARAQRPNRKVRFAADRRTDLRPGELTRVLDLIRRQPAFVNELTVEGG